MFDVKKFELHCEKVKKLKAEKFKNLLEDSMPENSCPICHKKISYIELCFWGGTCSNHYCRRGLQLRKDVYEEISGEKMAKAVELFVRNAYSSKRFAKKSKICKTRCEICGSDKKRVVAHHVKTLRQIIEEKDIRYFEDIVKNEEILGDTRNSLIVCDKCHQQIHKSIKKND